jgi:hypothetical protein
MTKISKPVRAVDDSNADTTECGVDDQALQPILRQRLDASMDREQMTEALTETFREAGFKIVPGSVNISRRRPQAPLAPTVKAVQDYPIAHHSLLKCNIECVFRVNRDVRFNTEAFDPAVLY